MSWTALIPLKDAALRKSRLAAVLDADARAALGERMFAHVAGVLARAPGIARIVLLAPATPAGWAHDWIADKGRGLNPELEAARGALGACDLVVIHADLPLLAHDDLAALLAAAQSSRVAVAPDRHDAGTNALALLAGETLAFGFGPGSFVVHASQAPDCAVVRRAGLALDVDTPDDLALARC